MALNNLPSAISAVIQTGFLERKFQDSLRARLGYRDVAVKEPFPAGIGESITKSRPSLLAAITTPVAAAANTDITSGLTAQNYEVEQYILGVNQYPGMMQLNCVTSQVAIDSLFLRNASTLAEQAARSVSSLAQRCLFDSYMGGNTRVSTSLGSAGTAVQVDDVRGFFQTINSSGQVVAVSSSNPLTVSVNGTNYTLNTAVADGNAPSTIPYWLTNLTFSSSGSNTSTAPNGFSGVLTFSANVSTTNATAGNAVIAAVAPSIQRPGGGNVVTGLTSSSLLTMETVLNAKAQLANNAVPPLDDGFYHCYIDAQQAAGLYQDTAFQRFAIGQLNSDEYKRGWIATALGVKFIETNLNPVQNISGTGNVRRALVVGREALIEGAFTNTAYMRAMADDGNGLSVITVIDGISHITRPPIDALGQVVTQSWTYIGGFVCPTDQLTTSSTIPTASAAAFKRAVILESV